jgi:hypothetical protein
MSKPLFDLAKCDVPFVNSVNFRFVSECSIQPPPPPIFDCPEPPKTFRVVPECPSIDGSIMISTAPEGCIPKRQNIVITRTPRCGGNEEAGCNFFIDLDLAIPVPTPPCPSINGDITVKTFPAGCPRPKNSVRVKPKRSKYSDCDKAKSKPGCLFDLDLSINVPIPKPPCPSIKGGSLKTSVFFKGHKTPKNSIRIKKRSLPKQPCGSNSSQQQPTCAHTIDLVIDIPIPPPPCPEFSKGSFSVKMDHGRKNPTGTITTRKLPPKSQSSCRFAIDLTLKIPVPPCPQFSKGSFSVKMIGPNERPKGGFKTRKLEPKNSSSCRFAIDLDLKIPIPPCPDFSKGSFSVAMDPGRKKPTGVIKTRKLPPKNSSSCRFAIDFNLKIPVPPCPQFSKGSFSVAMDRGRKNPTGVLTTRKLAPKNSSSCRFAIDFNLKIPVPPCPDFSKGSFSVKMAHGRKNPTGGLTTRKLAPKNSSSCRYAIDLTLTIPVPPCPDFSKGSFSVKMAHGRKNPTGAITTRKLAPKNSSSCRYAIDLTLNIPVPPCPQFSKGSFSVKMDRGRKNPTGGLTTRKLAPKNSSSCRYAIDLTLNIPVPPCPDFSKGSFSVKMAHGRKNPTGAITTRKIAPKNSSSCRYAVDFKLEIPVPPCPQFSKGSFSVKMAHGRKNPTGTITTRKIAPKNSSSCRYAVDFKLEIPVPPCPQFSKGSFSVKMDRGRKNPTGGLTTRKLAPKNSSSCRYAIDLTLNIPVPPCPDFSRGSFSVKMDRGRKNPTGTLTTRKLTPKNSSSCRYAIDLNLTIPVPPCPDFSKGSFSVKMDRGRKNPTGGLTTRKLAPKNSSSCRYAIDLNLTIPVPPCPDFSKGSFSVKMAHGRKNPTGTITTRKIAPKNSSSCRYAVDFKLEIPVPPCPDFSKGSFSVKMDHGRRYPTGAITTRKLAPKNSSSCRFAIDFNLKIPVPPCPDFSKGSFSVKMARGRKNPTGVIKTRRLEARENNGGAAEYGVNERGPYSSCRYAIDFDLQIPVPPCPQFSKGSFSVKMDRGRKNPTGTITTRKLEPRNSSSCRYAIDFNLKIPVPPCPDFSKGSFSVKMDHGRKNPTGTITTRKLAPKNSSSCRYAIDFNLKIPVPTCPDFSKGSFSVKMDHGRKNPTGTITTRKLAPKNSSSCRYAIDFNLKIPVPPCVQISKGSFSVKMDHGRKNPTGILVARKLEPRNSSSCRFALDFNIRIPVPPCPQLSIGLFSLSVRDPETLPTTARGHFKIKKLDPIGSSSCRTGIELGITIPLPKEVRRATFSGNWDKGSSKNVTATENDGSTKNISVMNELCNVLLETGEGVCYIGRDTRASQWYLLNWSCDYCSGTGTKAKDVSRNNDSDASDISALAEGDGGQVLLNDQGCAKWFKIKKQKIVYDLEPYNQGLKWKTKDVWVLDDSASPEDKEYNCTYFGPTYTGGTIDMGGYGSGSINITGADCNKTIAATITLNTTNCPSGPSGPSGPSSL